MRSEGSKLERKQIDTSLPEALPRQIVPTAAAILAEHERRYWPESWNTRIADAYSIGRSHGISNRNVTAYNFVTGEEWLAFRDGWRDGQFQLKNANQPDSDNSRSLHSTLHETIFKLSQPQAKRAARRAHQLLKAIA